MRAQRRDQDDIKRQEKLKKELDVFSKRLKAHKVILKNQTPMTSKDFEFVFELEELMNRCGSLRLTDIEVLKIKEFYRYFPCNWRPHLFRTETKAIYTTTDEL